MVKIFQRRIQRILLCSTQLVYSPRLLQFICPHRFLKAKVEPECVTQEARCMCSSQHSLSQKNSLAQPDSRWRTPCYARLPLLSLTLSLALCRIVPRHLRSFWPVAIHPHLQKLAPGLIFKFYQNRIIRIVPHPNRKRGVPSLQLLCP